VNSDSKSKKDISHMLQMFFVEQVLLFNRIAAKREQVPQKKEGKKRRG
jgi:hypothetical protein